MNLFLLLSILTHLPNTDHLESYSMHDGDWLNRNFRFDDVMYDGSREFGKVVNGLGLLNDGVHGILDDQLFDVGNIYPI